MSRAPGCSRPTRRHIRVRSARRHRCAVLASAVLVCAVLAGCAKAPLVGKGTLHVVLTAATDCNSCGKASGYPLTYRVLQVTDASPLTGASLTQLWDKEEKLLGPAFLKKRESVINPGQTLDLPIEREKGVTALVVVGSFCKTRGSSWYQVQPVDESGTVKLTAGPYGFTRSK